LIYDLEYIAGIVYFTADIISMSKYLFQMKTIFKKKKTDVIARKFFVLSLVRESAALFYAIAIQKWILIVLAVLTFMFNFFLLLLVIKYKKIPDNKNLAWDDKCYRFIKNNII